MERLRASVIVPAWNAREVIGRCLDSLAVQEFPGGFETIVVEDASTDGTADLLGERGDAIRVIANARNLGFGAGNNEGARAARGEVLFFLNSDTELPAPDALHRIVSVAERPDVGLAGPMLVNPDGTLQPSCAGHPGIALALLLATGLWRLLPDRVRARVAPQFWSHDRARDTDWLLGAAIAVRAEVFRAAGGFWPVTYAEEEDLAYRVRREGLRVRFEPSVRVMHVGNHSFGQRWPDHERAGLVAQAERAFLEAHYSRARADAIRLIMRAGWAVRAFAYRLLGRRDRARVFRSMSRAFAGGAA